MKPRRVPSSNFVFRLAGGNEDNDLWVERGPDPDGFACARSVWVPTDEERARLAAGENVELVVWSEGHPPVRVGVTDEQPGKAEAA